jgi:glycosyltransferase involved in cell wall biosynthesis
MKIAFGISAEGLPGGINVSEGAILDACKRRSGIEVLRFTFGSRSASEHLVQKVTGRLVDVVRFIRMILKEHPKVVHLNSAFDKRALLRDTLFIAAAKTLGQPLVLKFHGSDSSLVFTHSFLWRGLSRFTLTRASAVGVLSREEHSNFERAGFGHVNLVVMKNAVNAGSFAGRWNPGNDLPRMLFVGRFIEAKGLLDVIKALRIMIDDGMNAQLTCVGDGPIMPQAVSLADTLGLSGAIQFTGHVPESEVVKYYLCSDALVLPTYHEEGFPMVVFNALAAGIPILTTQIRAAADYLKEPDNCLWVRPRDPRTLADRATQLFKDRHLRDSMSQNNSELASTFTPDKVLDEYMQLYEGVRRA